MERWLRDIENYLVASDKFEEEVDGKNFDLIRKALERTKPKKPNRHGGGLTPGGNIPCPGCGNATYILSGFKFCPHCGQALDWSE